MAYTGKTRDYLLHLFAGEEVFCKAHDLRHPMTETEILFWDKIRFTNEQIFDQLDQVLKEIVSFVSNFSAFLYYLYTLNRIKH